MTREIKKYLFDIKVAIESIEEFIKDIEDLEAYQGNKLVRRAVEREIEIIGEATNRLLKLDDSVQIKNARKIVDTRNWVIHGYDNVDNVIIWSVVNQHLPNLKSDVLKLLNKE